MKRFLRLMLFLLAVELLLAFALGVRMRQQIEGRGPIIGSIAPSPTGSSALAAGPLHVGDARAPVLDSRQGKEQIAQAIEVLEREGV